MMSMKLLSAASRRAAVAPLTRQQQTRNLALGGHHGPPPEWTGIDKVVRGVFPQDYQLAIAILGGYVGLAVVGKLMSGGKKKEEPVAAAPASPSFSTSSSNAIPSIESDDFAKYLETDAFLKLLENEKELTAALG
ncbi:hypothetical protein MPSEU_000833700 [Mayamaea pseudoterrestris]|nr:hypothetical protein MPSEU_000833700 [Mayamaea pseudoterrestris]